ncbi:MAG: TonB-dependent receptor [Bacteroidales bacterium]|jgi:iron complex outermembrane receptor protein|nr:TonB-dependent receptor [Bacteroidales bacterium]
MKFSKKKKAILCFRHWDNKSFAAFKSLHKCVKIGVLCVTYSLSNISAQVPAQTDSTEVKAFSLDEVEVNAEALPDVFAQTGRTITQISRTDIEQAPVQSLTDILEFAPNVDLRQRGTYGTQADISIRGSSFDQTIVLLNGINISDPQTGHYTLNLPVDIESVEKIEILEGPAARIFGNNALGGAVNFVTGIQKNNYLKAGITGGQYGFYKALVSGALHSKQTSHHLAVSQTASDGYMANTDFKNLSIFTQNQWNNQLIPLDLQLGFTQKEFGANGFYGPKYPDQYEALNTFYAALKGATNGKIKISPSAYWRRNYDHYVLIRENPEAYQNFHYTDVYGANINFSLVSRVGKSSIGIISRGERIYSTNLGEDMGTPHKVPGQTDQWYTKTDQRNNLSLFAEQNLYIGKWSISAGLLFNHNNYIKDKIKVYPGIDLAFYPNHVFKIYTSVNQAMRLPTFTDLYYTGPMNMGNPDLKPEQCTEVELGTKMTLHSLTANIGYFYRNTTDAIDWIWLTDEQAWHTQNLTELHTHGISFNILWDVRRFTHKDFWLQSVSTYYNFMSSNKSADEYTSFYVLDYLKHKFNISITHRIIEKICVSWKIGWQDRNGSYFKYNIEDGSEVETPYEAFWQIDARIYRKTPHFNIFIEASNLTDKKHQDIGNITLPGIWARGGVIFTLGKAD